MYWYSTHPSLRKLKRNKRKFKWYDETVSNEDPKFIRYQLTTYYYKAEKGKYVKYNKTRHFDSMKDLYIPDGEDNYSVFPRLDITDSIMMLGDYYSTDYSQPKAWSEFSIKIDWLEV